MKRDDGDDDGRLGTMVRLDEYSHVHTREERREVNQMSFPDTFVDDVTGEKFKDIPKKISMSKKKIFFFVSSNNLLTFSSYHRSSFAKM